MATDRWLRILAYVKVEDVAVLHDAIDTTDLQRVVYEGSTPVTFVRFDHLTDLTLFVLACPEDLIEAKSEEDLDVLLRPDANIYAAREVFERIAWGRGEFLTFEQVALFVEDRAALDELLAAIRVRDPHGEITVDVVQHV